LDAGGTGRTLGRMGPATGGQPLVPVAAPSPSPGIRGAARTDAGPSRSNNEDAVLVRLDHSPGVHVAAVADGLGGHAAGEVASRIVVDTLGGLRPVERPERWLRQAFNAANLAIWNHAHSHPEDFNLQSTATAVLVTGGEAVIAHVGDCRCYLVRDGSAEPCTIDHTRAMEMLRLRIITAEQARRHPARSQLTRTLGAELFLNVDVTRRTLRQDDALVLCSDGLWNEVTREEIADVVSAVPDPELAAQALLRTALDRDAADNVSVVVVRVDGPMEAPAAPRGRRWLPWR
jgi:serine/threonine protein phosphatase PrpC